jgi:hypothetical protein
MAYMSQEMKKVLIERVKGVMPKGWKASYAVRDNCCFVVTIKSAPVDIIGDWFNVAGDCKEKPDYIEVNRYYIADNFSVEVAEALQKIVDAMRSENYDNSDVQRDYFDVGYYTSLKIGRWDKPFEVK